MTSYITKGPLHPEEHKCQIIDRPELDRLLDNIIKDDSYIALGNPRQTGKTTLLFQIQAKLHKKNYGVVYIDLEGMNDKNKSEFYKTICTEIWEGLKGLVDSETDSLLNHKNIIDQKSFSEYIAWLSSHTPYLRKIILILDEIGGVPKEVALTFFPTLRNLFTKGRSLSEDRDLFKKIVFVFAGALDIGRLCERENSPLLNVCTRFAIDDFTGIQSCKLASSLSGYSKKQIALISDKVYEWCNGHPYLTQRIYSLLEECLACRSLMGEILTNEVDTVVKSNFVYGKDENLDHVLRESDKYRDSLFEILRNQTMKSVDKAERDLLDIGIIKRSKNFELYIRNKIYMEVLNNLFKGEGKFIRNEK